MLYKVTKQFVNNRELDLKQFLKRDEAERLIQEKLVEDQRFKIQAIYRLYDDLDMLIKEYTQADIVVQSGSHSSSSQSASGKGSGQTFSPTPFNTKPQPGGMPRTFVKDNEEDE